MGLLSNTVSLTQFRVAGDYVPTPEWIAQVGERLQQQAMRSIERSSEELALGWVLLDDFEQTDFEQTTSWWREDYLSFSLRRDQRRVPAALVRGELQREQRRFLQENPGLHRVPRERNDELKELVRQRLLVRVLPSPTVYDVLWHLPSGCVTLCHLSSKAIDEFTDLFQMTFPGLRLVLFHPLERARTVVPELVPALDALAAVEAETPVLEQIEKGRWLGYDFLLWLAYQTLHGSPAYRVCRLGPASEEETFTAWLDERFQLTTDGGLQKVTVVGPQDNFSEVCTALRQGKQIAEATLYLEKNEHLWRLTLKGELFQLASFKCPAVRIDRSAEIEDEQLAVFYERMHVLEEGQQLFDSLLAHFLQQRLGDGWETLEARLQQWLAQP
ncbi:MAG: recombination-associated protein RdgC [Desulfuromonadaceae bacterium]|nr:recombination-associated protein RdgC [Desulfuromonadaceae bacterium]